MPNQWQQNSAGAPAPETDVASVIAGPKAGLLILVDVREPEEWRSGHIADAKHIPLGDLAARAAEIETGAPIVTVCRSGRRSLDAVDILNAAGYNDVESMAGGMIAWQEAGHPVSTD